MKQLFYGLLSLCLIVPATAWGNTPVKIGKTIIKRGNNATAKASFFNHLNQVQDKPAIRPVLRNQVANTQKTLSNVLHSRALASSARTTPQKDGHIFIARVDKDPDMRFSGTVFEVEYNGEKEVYGAIATHAITSDPNDPFGVMRHFKATVYLPGQPNPQYLEAEIVASFPVRTLDISLVKFSKTAEKLLTPYPLGHIGQEKTLQSVGYTHWGFSFLPERKILKRTPYSIHTSMPLSHTKRIGMCGSALLNSKAELVGIHTGSMDPLSSSKNQQTVSFVAPASYLHYLVEAYHNGGKIQFPFYIAPHHFIPLDINEYATFLRLEDANGTPLTREAIPFHFPHQHFKNLLKQYPQAKFLKLTTQQITWTKDATALRPADEFQDPYKVYLYDLENRKVLNTTQYTP